MKKKLVSIMLAAAMVVGSLAGCSNSNNSSTSSSKGDEKDTAKAESTANDIGEETEAAKSSSGEKIVIHYWTEDRHDMTYFEEKIEEFNATNTSNIEVVLTTITDDYANMLAMSYTSGTAPDIAGVAGGTSGFDLKTFVDAGIIVPVTDRITDADFQKVTDADNMIVEGMNAIDGVPYWIPTAVRSGSRMIYNQDVLDDLGITEYPTTLQELVDLSKEITDAGGGTYYGLGTTSSGPFGRFLQGVAEMSGVYPYDYTMGTFNFDGFKEIIETANQLFTDNSIFPGSTTQGVDAMRAQFAEGTFAIWANASQEAGVFTDQFPIDDFEWTVAELPTLDGEVKGSLTTMTQKGYLMFSSSKHPEESWEVIKYFSSEEFLKGYLESGYALPISDYMAGIIDSSLTGKLADFSLKEYEAVYPTMPAVSVEGDEFKDVIWSAVMGEIDVDTAIADLNKRYNEALEKDLSLGKVKRIIIENFDPLNPNAGEIQYLTE